VRPPPATPDSAETWRPPAEDAAERWLVLPRRWRTLRLPHSQLRNTIVIHDFKANAAFGPVFEAPRTVRASIQDMNRLIISDVGEEQGNEILAMVRPEDGPV